MTKKKILFVMRHMAYAGSEIVFSSLLKAIDYEKYDVSFLTNRTESTIFNMLPKDIKVYYQNDLPIKKLIIQDLKNKDYAQVIKGICYWALCRIAKDHLLHETFAAKIHLLKEEPFDLVAAFKPADIPCALYQFHAKKRAVWFHTYEFEGQPFAMSRRYIHTLEKFDKIFCVSRDIKEKIDTYSESLKEQTEVFYNLQDSYLIWEKADAEIPDMDIEKTKIVTVGRLAAEKGFDMIPAAAKMLKDDSLDFQWYIIGEGPERDSIVDLISRYGLEDHVILLGLKENPYPYMKNCDIYVQT